MKKSLLKLLSGIAMLGVAVPAYSLTIVPTFDSSITNSPAAAAIEAAINAAALAFQTNYTDNLTVLINFVSDPTVDLGESTTWGTTFPYQQYIAALRSRATSHNDTNAISHLPNSSTDPVIGGNQINLNLTLARLTGLFTGYGPDGFDSTISLNMTLMNLTRPPTNSNNYDLVSVVEHEVDEVLGTSSSLSGGQPIPTTINPADLFRYTTNLVRTFTTNGPDNAYFSVDGTNLWARYNTEPDGDYGDWWSANDIFWAPPGITPYPQVQDAFGDSGTVQDMGTNEMTLLDVVGYTPVLATPQTAPTLSIVRGGTGKVTLSWSTNASGFSLQERTNLLSGSWVASATGSTNPANITISPGQKFYRLFSSAKPAAVPDTAALVQPVTTPILFRNTHILHRRRP
jgi:hypothetical protein